MFSMDVAQVTSKMRKLADGLDRTAQTKGWDHAQRTASEIHAAIPVLTGRLASTAVATHIPYGGEVHYGGTLPYAGKIERRTHAVRNVLSYAPARFYRDMTVSAEQEIASL